MSLYTEYDIDLLKKKSEEIRAELEKIKNEKMEPTLEEQKKIQKLIKEYCIEKKRKLYGGYAWNLLIMNKNPADKIYTDDNKVADIDMYSPEPINDWYAICNLLHKNGFQYVLGEEAQHQETYSVKVNRIVFCDISYVPKNIYNRMPYIEINGLQCIHPSFATIDYLRMSSDPLASYWRFFECGEDLKGFKRFYKLQKNYPLPYNDRSLDISKPKEKVSHALETIFKYIINKKSIIVNGFYAYNYFCHMSGFNHIQIPFYEFVSINYREDALELTDLLKKEHQNITYDEYNPFFQFTDYSVEIYLGDDIICRIYSNNKKCTPYQDLSALNFSTDKPTKMAGNIRMGTYPIVLQYFLIDAIKQRVNNDKDMEKFYYHVVSHCIQTRNKYLKTHKKTFLDNSIFKEFVITCLGESVTPEKERMLLIEKRKKNKEPLVYRYDPKDGEKEAPKFSGFKNTSGNKISNPKNLKLSDVVKSDDDDYDEIEDENSQENDNNDKENKDQKGGEIYHKTVKQPYFDQIKNGEKIYEGRLKKGDFKKLKVGDFVVWEFEDKTCKTEIIEILEFPSFVEAISAVGLEYVLPTQAEQKKTVEEAINDVYRKFYSEELEKEFGVLMIKVKVIE
jgi:ASC-1-like (ASCH) protein